MQEKSFFSRVTKYATDGGSDPHENRLTEAFAALLEQVPGLTLELVRGWLDQQARDPWCDATWTANTATTRAAGKLADLSSDERREIQTQRLLRPKGKTRYVDIEIRLDRVRVRVEVKHGAELGDGQIEAYEEHGKVPVVILAPEDQLPFVPAAKRCPHVPQRSWQATIQKIEQFRDLDQEGRENGRKPLGEVDLWMINEFLKFAKEEGIMAAPPLSQENTDALSKWREVSDAEESFNEMVTIGVNHAAKLWGKKKEAKSSPGLKVIPSWEHFPLYSEDFLIAPKHSLRGSHWDKEEDQLWLEFKVSTELSGNLDEGHGDVLLIAGLSGDLGAIVAVDEETATGLDDDSNSELRLFVEGDCQRLMRIAEPKLFVGSGNETVDAQGEILGRWIVDSFSLVTK